MIRGGTSRPPSTFFRVEGDVEGGEFLLPYHHSSRHGLLLVLLPWRACPGVLLTDINNATATDGPPDPWGAAGFMRGVCMDTGSQLLDRSALKFNQIGIITFSLAGFILYQPLLPAIVAAVLIGGTIHPRLALFKGLYHHLLRPIGVMNAELADESREPHQFAQLLGGIVLLAGAVFLFAGWPATGWTLTWLVILLAATNLFFGFCAGCFVYYQLRRMEVPGFGRREEGESHDGTSA